jgi:hypothetical protein
MPTFRKFAFPDGATADKALQGLQPLDFAVPLGHLCAASDSEGNCIKTRPEFAVDILFHDTSPRSLGRIRGMARTLRSAFVQRLGCSIRA